MSTKGLEFLLDQRWSSAGIEHVNLGLMVASYALDPANLFKERYFQLHARNQAKLKKFAANISSLRKTVVSAFRDILVNQLHLKSDFISATMSFFKDQETKNLCNDQMGVVWSKFNKEKLLLKPGAISRELKDKGLAKFHLQERHRVITFEDLNEINH